MNCSLTQLKVVTLTVCVGLRPSAASEMASFLVTFLLFLLLRLHAVVELFRLSGPHPQAPLKGCRRNVLLGIAIDVVGECI